MVKEFLTSAVEQATEADGEEMTYPFKIDGVDCVAYAPGSGQLAILMAMIGTHNAWTTQAAGIIDFFLNTVDEPSRRYFAGRLLSREDKFGIDEVEQILRWLIGEWTANPTHEPSGSTESQQSAGSTSAVTTPAST